MGIPLFPSAQQKHSLSLSLSRSLSHSHANKHTHIHTHTHNHRPLPLVPYALLSPVPFAKEGGNPPGAHSSWPCWPPVVTDALGGLQSRVGGNKEEGPHLPAATHPRSPATRDPQHAELDAAGAASGGRFALNSCSHAWGWTTLPRWIVPFFFFHFYWGPIQTQKSPSPAK